MVSSHLIEDTSAEYYTGNGELQSLVSAKENDGEKMEVLGYQNLGAKSIFLQIFFIYI